MASDYFAAVLCYSRLPYVEFFRSKGIERFLAAKRLHWILRRELGRSMHDKS